MSGFIEGENRLQTTLFPEWFDDYITEDNSVRVIDVFIDSLDLSGMNSRQKLKTQDALATICPRCSNCLCMGAWKKCSRLVDWSVRLSATLK